MPLVGSLELWKILGEDTRGFPQILPKYLDPKRGGHTHSAVKFSFRRKPRYVPAELFSAITLRPSFFVCSVATILPQSSTNNLIVTSTERIHHGLAYCFNHFYTVGLAWNKATLFSNLL